MTQIFIVASMFILNFGCAQKEIEEVPISMDKIAQGKASLFIIGAGKAIGFSSTDGNRWKSPLCECESSFAFSVEENDSTFLYYNFWDTRTGEKSYLLATTIYDEKKECIVFANIGTDFFEGKIVLPSFDEYIHDNLGLLNISSEDQKVAYERELKLLGFDFDYTDYIEFFEQEMKRNSYDSSSYCMEIMKLLQMGR